MSISDFNVLPKIARDTDIGYFCPEPLIGDFTKPFEGKFIISTGVGRIRCDISQVSLKRLVYNLGESFFRKSRTILTWDIKRFISYLRMVQKGSYKPLEGRMIDLKYGLAYLAQSHRKPPESLIEALALSPDIHTDPLWRKVNALVHTPLATEVLPAMETRGVFDMSVPEVKYSNYEIEGQVNGRLSTPKLSNRFLTVHSLTPQQKVHLSPRRRNDRETYIFIEVDFVHMEVSMLQWLTGDAVLGSDLAKSTDFYETLFNFKGNAEKKRKAGKAVFLPVAYGLQSANLAKRLKMSELAADTIIRELKDRFSKCFSWLDEREELLADKPIATDYLGRRRDFSGEPSHKRRNFEVQSPAATVCLEKLVHLYRALPDNVLFHIHDGYILTCKMEDFMEVAKIAKDVLESESELCPGLRFKTKCRVGRNLFQLKEAKPRG